MDLSPVRFEFRLDEGPASAGEAGDEAPDADRSPQTPRKEPPAKSQASSGTQAETKPNASADGALELASVLVRIPGASSDELLLATPFDSAPVPGLPGANEGASGAAVLLELARVLSREPQPYSVVLAFLDGELLRDDQPWLGSRALVHKLASTGELDRVRLLVYLHRVGDRDLRISRDLRSNRVFREKIFRAAARQGYENIFDSDQLFDDVPGGHRAFEEAGFRRFVALVDPREGGSEEPGSLWRTPQDDAAHCAPQSLQAVGRSLHAGLRDIAALLAKVDHYASPPESESEPAPPEPQAPSPTAEPSPEAETSAPEQPVPTADGARQAPATSPAR